MLWFARFMMSFWDNSFVGIYGRDQWLDYIVEANVRNTSPIPIFRSSVIEWHSVSYGIICRDVYDADVPIGSAIANTPTWADRYISVMECRWICRSVHHSCRHADRWNNSSALLWGTDIMTRWRDGVIRQIYVYIESMSAAFMLLWLLHWAFFNTIFSISHPHILTQSPCQ